MHICFKNYICSVDDIGTVNIALRERYAVRTVWKWFVSYEEDAWRGSSTNYNRIIMLMMIDALFKNYKLCLLDCSKYQRLGNFIVVLSKTKRQWSLHWAFKYILTSWTVWIFTRMQYFGPGAPSLIIAAAENNNMFWLTKNLRTVFGTIVRRRKKHFAATV